MHLEFGTNFKPPQNADADLMILAGDIITFKNFKPLTNFLSDWNKPVLFVAGNHEYYTRQSIEDCELAFKEYISKHHLNLTWLKDSDIVLFLIKWVIQVATCTGFDENDLKLRFE